MDYTQDWTIYHEARPRPHHIVRLCPLTHKSTYLAIHPGHTADSRRTPIRASLVKVTIPAISWKVVTRSVQRARQILLIHHGGPAAALEERGTRAIDEETNEGKGKGSIWLQQPRQGSKTRHYSLFSYKNCNHAHKLDPLPNKSVSRRSKTVPVNY